MRRILFAFKCFFVLLFSAKLPDDMPVEYVRGPLGARPAHTTPPALAGSEAAAPPQPRPIDRAVQMLALLQRDGRLVDFLYEDISRYPDDQVGAAVREVHANCRKALEHHLALEPVLDGEEGRQVVVPAGFEPATVKLVGNVAGQPPFRGVLQHHGWRATRVDLPSLVEGGGSSIVAPAEVELA